MKHNHLKEAVLLGLAMEMAACTTGMAKDITGQITDTSHNGTYSDNVTITNGNSNYAAIQIGHEEDGKPKPDYTANVNISTTKNHNITIDSEGYGIRTEHASTGTIYLNSSKDNIIQFGSGSGISNNANGTSNDGNGVNIKLHATNGTNSITYTGTSSGDAKTDDHDGINAGANNTGSIELTGDSNEIDVVGTGSDGIYTDTGSNSDVTLTAEAENNTIIAGNNGIDHRGSGEVTLTANEAANDITAGTGGDGARIEGNGTITITGKSNRIHAEDDGLNIASNSSGSIKVHSTAADNEIHGDNRGIHAVGGKVTVTADTGKNSVSGYRGIWAENGTVKIDAEIGNNDVKGEEVGIYDDGGTVTLTGTSNSISGATGVNAEAGSVEMQAAAGTNVIKGGEKQENNGIYDKGGTVSLNGYKNEISGGTGIQVESGKVSLEATGNNEVTGHANYGITAQAGTVDLISKATNVVSGGNIITPSVEMRDAVLETFGAGYAVHASGELGQEQTKVTFSAADQNRFLGAVYASGNASVEMGFDQYIGGGSMGNYVASSAVIGKSKASEASEEEDIVSALYAGNGASITVKGMENTILSSVASTEKSGSGAVERTIWASKGGSIEIDGKSLIAASQAGKDNVIGIAMAAGTGDWDKKDLQDGKLPVLGDDAIRSTITLNYGAGSQITGDVVSGYGGNIVISSTS